jgi:hypothetical protein
MSATVPPSRGANRAAAQSARSADALRLAGPCVLDRFDRERLEPRVYSLWARLDVADNDSYELFGSDTRRDGAHEAKTNPQNYQRRRIGSCLRGRCTTAAQIIERWSPPRPS